MPAADRPRWVAISNEVDAVSSLFRHGLRVLDGYRFAANDAESLFALLSSGAEKLLKLSLGFEGLSTDGAWRSTRDEGHGITRLDAQTRAVIRNGVGKSTAPGFMHELLHLVDEDPYIDQVLLTLERYAMKGRYYNLDHLAGKWTGEQSPVELWEELHQALHLQYPELLEAIGVGDWEQGRSGLNARIAASIRQWFELLERAWRTGVFGPEAPRWAGQLQIDLGFEERHPEAR